MSKIIISKVDEVFFRLNCDISQCLELKSHLSVLAPNFQFHPKFKAKMWDGRISFFDMATKQLPIGLLPKFVDFCKKFDYEYGFDFDKMSLVNDITENQVETFAKKIKSKYNSKFDFKDREYQLEAIHKGMQCKRGVLLLPTGSGKSFVIYNMLQMLRAMNKKILLVVPTTSLVEQMYNDFIEYGWLDLHHDVTKLYSGQKPDFSKQILISTWQSIHKKQGKFFENFDAVFVDETHGAKSLSIQSIAKKSINAEYRIGLTGTLPTVDADNYNIHGYLGPTIYKKRADVLIEEGVLSKIKIGNILLKYPKDVITKNKRRPYIEETETVYNYPARNLAFNHVLNHIPDGQNTLILCHLIDHLKDIKKHLEDTLDSKYTIYEIHGKIKTEERERIRNSIDKQSNVILIGTYATMSTGINIKKIHNVIFGSSYKAKIKILQSIGRGLRKHATKKAMILWDLIDDLRWTNRNGTVGKNHLFKHWDERLKYYDEQGFKHHTGTFKLYK